MILQRIVPIRGGEWGLIVMNFVIIESVKAQIGYCQTFLTCLHRTGTDKGRADTEGNAGPWLFPGRGMLQNCDHLITDTRAACRRVPASAQTTIQCPILIDRGQKGHKKR